MHGTLEAAKSAVANALAPFFTSELSEPDTSDVHVPTLPKGHTHDFLKSFRERVLSAVQSGTVTDADLMDIMKRARGYAGGKARAAKKAELQASEILLAEEMSYQELECEVREALEEITPGCYVWIADLYPAKVVYTISPMNGGMVGGSADMYQRPYEMDAEGNVTLGDPIVVERQTTYVPDVELTERALSEFTWGVELGEVGKPIQIMRTGDFQHPEYGPFSITSATLAEIKKNFDAGVRGQDLPIDIDHNHSGGAVGWMKSLSVQDDTLWATPEWTDDGAEDVRDGKYRYFSPHFGPWKDPESGTKYSAVLMSGAITNFPFLKNMEPIALSEFATRKEGQPMAEQEQATIEAQLSEARAAQAETERKLAEFAERESAAVEREKKLTEEVAVMRRDSMVKRLTEQVRGNGNPNERIIGDEDQIVTHLVKLAETFGEDSDEVKFAIQREQGHSAALRQAGAFTEAGSSGVAPAAGSSTEIETKVTEIMATEKVSRGVAYKKLAEREPGLYARHNEQTVKRS